ncbi:MAG TPA: sigma-70 family RNA polymerase sigma factor [Candidatus Polarisedimenticolaceae bacterium]|nr:sigma-70 family RNA polymerase sigma factor [Candidatus Polarisedimenticolaceae bacterium]
MDDASASPALERELIDRSRRGDRAAFDAIVVAHRLTVYRVARRILGSHEAADEAAQETFVRAWKSLGQFRGDARLSTWLVRIALNVSRTQVAARRAESSLDEAELIADGGESPDTAAERAESGQRVRRAVAALPPRQREVVLLKVFSGMTYEEVAAAMELSVGAVKAHFHQAVHNLKRRMSALGVER